MIFSVSSDGIEWSLDFGPDSVTLTEKDFVQGMTTCSQEVHLAALSLLMSQRLHFRTTIWREFRLPPTKKGLWKLGAKYFRVSVGAQDKDTSGYQMSALDDVEFYFENDRQDIDAAFTPGIDTPFSPSTFNDFEMSSVAENTILIDEEENKENFPPSPTTPVSERPTRPPALLRSRPFGTRTEKVPNYVDRNFFE